jgi:hypothetical protein
MSTEKKRVTIIRAPKGKDNPYFLMLRTTAQDEVLSFEARGVLAYLLSKSDNWELQPADLMKVGHCGRDRVNRIIKELKEHHYLKAEQPQDDIGKFERNVYTLYETPFTENPSTDEEKPSTENPLTGNPLTENPLHKEYRNSENPDSQKDIADTPSAVSAGEVQTPETPAAESPQDTPKSKRKPTAQQAMFEAVCLAWGYALDTLTPSKDKIIGGVASELVAGHARPDQIPGFKEWLARKAEAEKWTSYTIHTMKTYWPDYAATLPQETPPGEWGIDPKFDQRFAGLDIIQMTLLKDQLMIEQLEKQFGGVKK